MTITLLNGSPLSFGTTLEKYLGKLVDLLHGQGYIVNNFQLKNLSIDYCKGCFKCWVETPGNCIIRDDMPTILASYLESNVVILASPITMGFVSGLLKRSIDRLLPIFHPYLTIQDGLFYHRHRYKKNPSLILLLEREIKTTDVDLDLIDKIFKGMNLNYSFLKTTDESLETIANEISNI
jgi:multimeric flavodoxin WrbA